MAPTYPTSGDPLGVSGRGRSAFHKSSGSVASRNGSLLSAVRRTSSQASSFGSIFRRQKKCFATACSTHLARECLHCVFHADPAIASGPGGQLLVRDLADGWPVPVTPLVGPSAALVLDMVKLQEGPRSKWFHYCKPCQLSWLLGPVGTLGAHSHPSHFGALNSRTVAVWVAVAVSEPDLSFQSGEYKIRFGGKSALNTNGELMNLSRQHPDEFQIEVEYAALAHCLKEALQISDIRFQHIKKAGVSNSIEFLQRSAMVDLAVFTPLEVVKTVFMQLTWDPLTKEYQDARGNSLHPDSSRHLKTLRDLIELLATNGIAVRWFYCPQAIKCPLPTGMFA